MNLKASLDGTFDLAGVLGTHGELNERDGVRKIDLVYGGITLGSVSLSISGKTVNVYSNGYKVLSFEVPDEADRYYVSIVRGGLKFDFLVTDVAPNPIVGFVSTVSVPTIVRWNSNYNIFATITTRLSLTTIVSFSTIVASPITEPTTISYNYNIIVPFSYSTIVERQVSQTVIRWFSLNRTFTHPTTIIVPLRIPGESMTVSTTLIVNKTFSFSRTFVGQSTVSPLFVIPTTNLQFPTTVFFTMPTVTGVPTVVSLSSAVSLSTLLSFTRWLSGPVSFSVATTLVETTLCTTRLNLVKAQVNSFEVSVATTVPIYFEDVFEGSYIYEVGQFKGDADSELDVKVSYFDRNSLQFSTIVDLQQGGVLHGELSTGSRIIYNGSNFDINVIGKKGIVARWNKDAFSIKDFGEALPHQQVVDASAIRTDERWRKSNQLVFQIGPNEGANMLFGIDKLDSGALGLIKDSLNVESQDSSERTITVVDNAIQKVSSVRSQIGAVQNRLEHTIANLQIAAENLTAAESRIRDADMAKEMMQFTKYQILMQSGMAMLAQSNALPQNVLQLLRG
ncbi:flagellin [Fervidobacterium thailandense]|uniref:flagellin n=2 Tax=Fervidobacterium thailandense TaxID=1008305 RepID=UPI00355C16B1